MNAYLLFRDRTLYEGHVDPQLLDDLELPVLMEGMATGDSYIYETATQVFSRDNQCTSPDEICYRQDILSDCMENANLIRDFYRIIGEAGSKNRDTRLSVTHKKAKYMLDVAVKVMSDMQEPLKTIWTMSTHLRDCCRSEGLNKLCEGLNILFEPGQLEKMTGLIKDLSTKEGIAAVAVPGSRLRAEEYHPVRMQVKTKKGFLQRLIKDKDSIEFDVDMNEAESSPALSALRDAMSVSAASVVVQARDELFEFLGELKRELSFYIGCMNLMAKFEDMNIPFCRPEFFLMQRMSAERDGLLVEDREFSESFRCRDLYNVTLSLINKKASVPSSADASDRSIVMITGPNQGGKTTFLRSLGQAILMMNSGMSVAADSFTAGCGQIYTHFIREEDRTLRSGKLDEELIRMSEIVDCLHPGDWVLCNESFSSTNEQEGAEIALGIVTALQDRGIHVAYVTHFYQLVTLLDEQRAQAVCYLNAGREEDGSRTWEIRGGKPEVKGYGGDLYREIFM